MASVIASSDVSLQLLAMKDGLYTRSISDGALILLSSLAADSPAKRSNDGRVHPVGALWIGTMGNKAEHGVGANLLV